MQANGTPDARISIIVPCWRNDGVTEADAADWLRHEHVAEVIVAAPAANRPASPSIRHVPCSRAGRGSQMNEAARAAVGGVLLFHHADTELTHAHLDSLGAAMRDARIGGGAFRRKFDERHPHLRWLEPWEALRCRLFGPLFGDQSIFARREAFEAIGGFPEAPLMEDVAFSLRLRRRGPITLLAPAIASSPRRHLERGRWRSTLANALFLTLYTFGASPGRLHAWYYRA